MTASLREYGIYYYTSTKKYRIFTKKFEQGEGTKAWLFFEMDFRF